MTGQKSELWNFLIDLARLVQNTNRGNCEHTSRHIIRTAHRFAISARVPKFDPVEFCDRAEELASEVRRLGHIDANPADEIRIKRNCLEILKRMNQNPNGPVQEPEEVQHDVLQRKIAGR